MTLRPLSRPLLAVAISAAVALGAGGCGSDDDPGATDGGDVGTTAGDDGGSGEAAAGTIVAEDFSLSDATVGPGEEIVLENRGGATHTATADDGAFDLGQVAAGETSDPGTAPTEPGAYAFHCEIHNSMTATLTVEG